MVLYNFIEFHDSKLESVFAVQNRAAPKQIIAIFTFYVHLAPEADGHKEASGLWQAAALSFAEGVIEGEEPEPHEWIMDGVITLGGAVMNNILPLELDYTGDVVLELEFNTNIPTFLKIRGTGVRLTLLAAPEIVHKKRP